MPSKTAAKQKKGITFKPQAVTKRLLSAIPERARDVIVKRYGLGANAKRLTLEAIGGEYDITRERVRQIENYALAAIRKSEAYKKEQAALDELESYIESLGAVIPEDELLTRISKDGEVQNHVHFLLVVGDPFFREKESPDFTHHWYVDEAHAKQVKDALRKLYQNLSDDDLIPESEIIERFLKHLESVSEEYKNEEVAKRWLSLSKTIGRNPLGEWGKTSSSNVSLKGLRDYAYLVIRQHGSPMHFTEVAKRIEALFKKEAHIATTHNELIKDQRFVLVGRGLYALSEWGYVQGVVKDVIKAILSKQGPLSRQEVVDRVLKERYVKPNTIAVNLQDTKTFKRLSDGRYALI